MTLVELGARLIASSPDGGKLHDVATLAEAHGVIFECPGCREHSIVVWNPRAPEAATPRPRWTMTGTGIADLTLTPSINLLSGCRWHGWVTGGQIHDAQIKLVR